MKICGEVAVRVLWIAVLPVCLTASACPDKTMTVGFNHVRTSHGYINHSLRDNGVLFLWNRKAGTLRRLETISLVEADFSKPVRVGDISASVKSGVTVLARAKVTPAIEGEVKGQMDSQSSYELKNAVRKEIAKPVRPLNRQLKSELIENRAQIERDWLVQIAVRDPNNYKYLFVTETIRADEATFKFGRKTTTGGKVTVVTRGGEVEVTMNHTLDDRFKGKQAPVTFEITPLRLIFVPCKGDSSEKCAAFIQDTTVDRTKLTELLKSAK